MLYAPPKKPIATKVSNVSPNKISTMPSIFDAKVIGMEGAST